MIDTRRTFFEDRAPTWDDMMPADLDAALHRMIAPFASALSAAGTLLEIGTGTGALIPHLVRSAPGTRLVCIDLAHGMLRRARERGPAARLVQCDAHHLPFPSGAGAAFDVVVCHNSFPHFADRLRALGDIQRVLRPGGQLLILHNNPRARVNAIHSRVGGAVAHDLLPPGAELDHLLRQTGYIKVWVDDAPDHYVARAQRPAP